MTDKPSGDRIRERAKECLAFRPDFSFDAETSLVLIEQMAKQVRDEAIEEAAMLASEVIHSKLLMVNDEALDQIRNLKTSVSKEGSKESRGKA